MHTQSRIVAILGTGAWGSALGKIAGDNGSKTQFWSHRGQMSLESVVQNAEVIVSAVAMKGVIPTAQKLSVLNLPTTKIIVTATIRTRPRYDPYSLTNLAVIPAP